MDEVDAGERAQGEEDDGAFVFAFGGGAAGNAGVGGLGDEDEVFFDAQFCYLPGLEQGLREDDGGRHGVAVAEAVGVGAHEGGAGEEVVVADEGGDAGLPAVHGVLAKGERLIVALRFGARYDCLRCLRRQGGRV